jgi:hypothetical protein
MNTGSFKRTIARLPIAMSLIAIAIVVVYVAMFGPNQQHDEGAVAHVWQILMLGQLPFMVLYAALCLPQSPKPTLRMLALQVGAATVALALVFILNL